MNAKAMRKVASQRWQLSPSERFLEALQAGLAANQIIAIPLVASALLVGKHMRQAFHELDLQTRGKGLKDFTNDVEAFVREAGIGRGLLTMFCRHTSASLIIQENADPDVQADLRDFFERVAPEDRSYIHGSEGPDDMPAHIRAALTQTQLSIPVLDGRVVLGTWQGIYLFEHRRAPHRRRVMLHVIGE